MAPEFDPHDDPDYARWYAAQRSARPAADDDGWDGNPPSLVRTHGWFIAAVVVSLLLIIALAVHTHLTRSGTGALLGQGFLKEVGLTQDPTREITLRVTPAQEIAIRMLL